MIDRILVAAFVFAFASVSNGGDLVSRWRLDGLASANQLDLAGTNHAIPEGSLSSSNDWFWGRPVIYFNGSNSLRIPNSVSLNPDHLTVSAWIKPDNANRNQNLVTKDRTAGGSQRVWQLRTLSDGSLYFVVFNASSYGSVRAGSLASGIWHHVAGTWDGETIRLYVNGEEIGNTTFVGTLRSNQHNSVYIGRSENSNPRYYQGRMSDVRVYGYALASDEIRRIYVWPSQIAHWKLSSQPMPSALDALGHTDGIAAGSPTLMMDDTRRCTRLDGVNDSFNVGSFNHLDLSGDFSFAVWVNSAVPGYRAHQIFSKDLSGASSQYRSWQFRLSKRGKPEFIAFVNGQAKTVTAPSAIKNTGWRHVSVVRDSSAETVNIYIDGVLSISSSVTGPFYSGGSNSAHIGRSDNASSGNFAGDIADLRVFETALTGEEVERVAKSEPDLWTQYKNAIPTGDPSDTTLANFAHAGAGGVMIDEYSPGSTACGIQRCLLNGEISDECHLFNVACYNSANGGNTCASNPCADTSQIQSAIDQAVIFRGGSQYESSGQRHQLIIYFPEGTYGLDQTGSDADRSSPLNVSASDVLLLGEKDAWGKLKSVLNVQGKFRTSDLPSWPYRMKPAWAVQFAPADVPYTQPASGTTWAPACLRDTISERPPGPLTLLDDGTTGPQVNPTTPGGMGWVTVQSIANLWSAELTLEKHDPCPGNSNEPTSCPTFRGALNRFGYERFFDLPDPPNRENDWTRGSHVREHFFSPWVISSGNRHSVVSSNPFLTRLDSSVGDWYVYSRPVIRRVGMRDLKLTGDIPPGYLHQHTSNPLADHFEGYEALCLDSVVDSVVENVEISGFSDAVRLMSTRNVTLYKTKITGNPGHTSIRIHGGTNTLVARFDDQSSAVNGTWHGPAVTFGAAGTVFYRGSYSKNSTFDAHATMPYATLFDNVEGGLTNDDPGSCTTATSSNSLGCNRSGGPEKGQPNHLDQFVMWNFRHKSAGTGSLFDFWVTNVEPLFADPIVVGFMSDSLEQGFRRDAGEHYTFETTDSLVSPESLFEAQVEYRLGTMPNWLCRMKNDCDLTGQCLACP